MLEASEWLDKVWKMELEEEIKHLRIQECAIMHGFERCAVDDYLWVQLGGPIVADRTQQAFRTKRLALEDVYYKVFGEHYQYEVFNEI